MKKSTGKTETRPVWKIGSARKIFQEMGNLTETSMDEAINRLDKTLLLNVMSSKYNSLMKNNTWTLVDRSSDKLLHVIRVFASKRSKMEQSQNTKLDFWHLAFNSNKGLILRKYWHPQWDTKRSELFLLDVWKRKRTCIRWTSSQLTSKVIYPIKYVWSSLECSSKVVWIK